MRKPSVRTRKDDSQDEVDWQSEEEEDDDEEKEVKDVKLKVEEEERMEHLRIEDGEVACKGEVGTKV